MNGDTIDLDALFKINWGGKSLSFKNSQNLKAPIIGMIDVAPEKLTPRGIEFPANISGNEVGGFVNEGETLQEADSELPVKCKVLPREGIYPFKISGRALTLSEGGDKVAFATGLDRQMTGKQDRMNSDRSRQFFGNGIGIISLANGAGVATTSLVVDNPILFRRNMYIDAYATIGGAIQFSGVKITGVNYDTKTLTLASAQSWADNSIIVKRNVQNGAPAGGKEITGFDAIVDTTTYSTTFQDVNVLVNSEFQGNVLDAQLAPLNHDLMLRALNRGRVVGGADPDMLICNYVQARVFLNSELQKVRYTKMDVEAGDKDGPMWNSMKFIQDKDCQPNQVYMLDSKEISRFQSGEPDIADSDGRQIRYTAGKNELSGFFECYENLGTAKRDAHIKLTNLGLPGANADEIF